MSSLIDGSDIKDEFSTDIYDPNQVEKLDFNQAPTSGDIFGDFEDDDNQVLSIVGNEPDNDNLFAKPKSGSQDYFVSKTKPVSFLDDLNTYETSQDEKSLMRMLTRKIKRLIMTAHPLILMKKIGAWLQIMMKKIKIWLRIWTGKTGAWLQIMMRKIQAWLRILMGKIQAQLL